MTLAPALQRPVLRHFVLLMGLLGLTAPLASAAPNTSLRVFGNGFGDIDRVKIKLDRPATPIDVAGNFTLEFWLKAHAADNQRGAPCRTGRDGWIVGHIILDRDVYGNGDYGDYGVSLGNDGRLAFGVARGARGTTLCSNIAIADGAWHHVALTRRSPTGDMRIYIDGRMRASGRGPAGNISYRNNRQTRYPNDAYLVIGAEKHDAGVEYPSFSGWIDELRVSKTIRYTTTFKPPTGPFTADTQTAALYHFDEGVAGAPCQGTVRDAAPAGRSSGVCRYGGNALRGPIYSADTPFGARQSGEGWNQFGRDAQRTSFNANSIPLPWRVLWIWNGPNATGGIATGKFGLPRNSQPVIGGGRVYVAAGARGVYGLDDANGRVLWQRGFAGQVLSTPAYDPDTDRLFVLTDTGEVAALNAATGAVLQRDATNQPSALPLPPALSGTRLFIATGRSVLAFDTATLRRLWRYDATTPMATPPAYSQAQDRLVVVGEDLFARALDAATGHELWRTKPTPLSPGNPTQGHLYASARKGWPVIADGQGIVFIRYQLPWETLWSASPWPGTNAAMRAYLLANRQDQPLFALHLSNGSEALIPNVGNGGYGNGDYLPMGPLPVIKRSDDGTELAYVVMRGQPCDGNASACDGRADSHLGELLLDDTSVAGYGPGDVRYIAGTFLPTDEQPFLSMAGDDLFAGHWEVGTAHRITDRTSSRGTNTRYILTDPLPHIATSQDVDVCGTGYLASHACALGLQNTRTWPGGFYRYWRQGAVYDRYWSEYASWVIGPDKLYFVGTDGAVLALGTAGRATRAEEAPVLTPAVKLPVRADANAPAALGLREHQFAADFPGDEDPSGGESFGVLHHTRAASVAGRAGQIQGTLRTVLDNGKAVYLGFRNPHRGGFKVLIPKASWSNFPVHPTQEYQVGQTLSVTGLVTWYQGDPAIYIDSPSAIQVQPAPVQGRDRLR